MPIKAVIFDLNGVFLLSKNLSERLAEKSDKSLEEILGVMKPILKEVRNTVRKGEEVWTPLLNLVGMRLDEFFEFYFSGESINDQMCNYARSLRDGGFKVFTLSNNFKERTEYYRKYFPELFEVVDKSYFSWETGFVKPDPMAFQNLLIENDLKGEECIYVDDSEDNLEASKEFGIKGIKYESGEQVIEEMAKILNSSIK